MKTIIVPTDFSAVATNALHYAIDMARSIDASLLVLNVYQVPVTFTEVPVIALSLDEIKQISEEKMAALKKKIDEKTGGALKVYTECRLGDVVDEIESVSKSIQPLTIVMGTKGQSTVERLFLGSNTLTAIRHLSFPILVVPPDATFKPIRRIGFACDFEKVVDSTPVKPIHQFCNAFNASLYVLNVDHKNKHFTPGTPEESLLLHTMIEDLNPTYHFIDDSDIEMGIQDFAKKNDINLIITIPKKHKLLDSLFQRSHSKDLIFHAHLPILCIHE
jgi:nucleotide-binding universal stress UspA family protein